MNTQDERSQMTLEEIVDETHLHERPYVQALLLIVSYPTKDWDAHGHVTRSYPDPQPFYFEPLQRFEMDMRSSGRVPEGTWMKSDV